MKKPASRNPESRNSVAIPYRFIFFIIIWIIYAGISIYAQVFRIRSVSCTHSSLEACSEPIIAELQRLQGSFFFSHDIEQTMQKIKRSDLTVQEIHLKKKFPQTAIFTITAAQPFIAIQCPDVFLSMSAGGDIQESRSDVLADIPLIQATKVVCEQFLLSRKIEAERAVQIKDFYTTVQTNYPEYGIEIRDASTFVMKTSSEQRILLLTEQLAYQFNMYRYLQEHQALPQQWTELDLRFQRAIVK